MVIKQGLFIDWFLIIEKELHICDNVSEWKFPSGLRHTEFKLFPLERLLMFDKVKYCENRSKSKQTRVS